MSKTGFSDLHIHRLLPATSHVPKLVQLTDETVNPVLTLVQYATQSADKVQVAKLVIARVSIHHCT